MGGLSQDRGFPRIAPTVEAVAGHNQRGRDEGADHRGRPPPLRRTRLRLDEPHRDRRRGRDPPAEPAAPLPVEGSALPGRAALRPGGLGDPGHGRRRRSDRGLAAGRAGRARRVPLLRGAPRVRAPDPAGGARRRADALRAAEGGAAADVRPGRPLPPGADGRRPAPAATTPASCCSPATAPRCPTSRTRRSSRA